MDITIVEKIIGSVAEAENTSPGELDILLHEWIDVDVIRQLVEHDSTEWELQFDVDDHTVTVTGDGTVHVDGIRRRTVPDP